MADRAVHAPSCEHAGHGRAQRHPAARQAWDVTCPPEFQVDEVVSMRLLEGGRMRMERFRLLGVVRKDVCMSIIYPEPLGPDSAEIELKHLDFRRLGGVVTFDQESPSSPLLADRAMKLVTGRLLLLMLLLMWRH